jgi:NAD(P)-dependent dehydrogenase (short-subunit alcohol dehydrogenase family)
MNIQNKRALVTGGAHRVGRTIALELARLGADVAVNYNRSAQAAQETVAEIEALGRRGMAIQADIGELAQVQAMMGQIGEAWGGLEILVNSADLWAQTPFPITDYATWQRVMDITIHGSFYVSNEALPLMGEGPGVIVNILDLSVRQAWRGYTAHAVAKSGLLALTRQLALELAPAIRVNGVIPGNVLPPLDADEESVARGARAAPLKRWGSAQDVAQAVAYLVQADFVTGETLTVDGGLSVR